MEEIKNQQNMANMVQLSETRLDSISLEIAKDSMSAHILVDITGVSLRDFSPTMIYNVITNSKLNEELVNFSVIKEIVDEVTKRKKQVLPINHIVNPSDNIVTQQIATGLPLVHGLDGWVKFFHPHNQRVVIKEDGSADFRNLEKFISIKKDDKIATLFAGVPGTAGKDVYGMTLNPPAIKRPKITIGANIITVTNTSPEEPEKIYVEYTSACNGVLFSTDESVSVSPELRIEQSVGISTGNVTYDGTVNVVGSIEDGARVECQGSLNVAENLESSDITVGKDLFVKGGIKAKAKGLVKIAGTVKAKFIENSILEIGGDLIIEGYILNSKIFCLGSIVMSGPTSAILGSEIIVMGGLSTYNLGSNAGVDVIIELGAHFQNERLFNEFQNKVKASEKEMANIIPQVQQANNMIKQLRGKLDDDKKKKFTELFELFKQKSANHKFVTEKFEELKTSRFNQEQINIVVKGAAFPGAVIKYRRQIEKISVMQSAFMMSFLPGQDSAPMTAINTKKK
ncbi:MAG: DUF342 domain-containing protein [Leptospiraceae bacterium]|nr:DUF342 domain-containing protein [Leptospiraceae bacterium]